MPPNKKITSENTERQPKRPSRRMRKSIRRSPTRKVSRGSGIGVWGLGIVAIWSFICSRRAESSAPRLPQDNRLKTYRDRCRLR